MQHEVTVDLGHRGMCDMLDLARLPMAVLEGSEQIVHYANHALCQLTGIAREELIGKAFAEILPEGDSCLSLLDRVYRTGNAESHVEAHDAEPHPLYSSYEIWPVLNGSAEDGFVGIIIQFTETTPFHRQSTAANEALLLAGLRQQELREEAETVNRQLKEEMAERKRVEVEIKELAFYDPLTNLPNRRLLMDRLRFALVLSARTLHHGAILFIDLDDFKTINDTHGHHIGDLLLQQAARRLTTCVRECDTVARLGGDEFVVMIQNLSEDSVEADARAKRVAQKILGTLSQPYVLVGHEHRSTGSIGITMFSKNRESVEDLLKRADLALYRAKAAGGSAVRSFDPEMQAIVTSRAVLDTDLRRGLEENQFILHYQPQVDGEGHVTGAEALLRWKHPNRGLLHPAEFIPFAEEKGLIEPLGRWVLQAACQQLMAWSLHSATKHLTLAINVSALEFSHPEFVTRMLTVVDHIGADPRKIVLEFTERVMLGSVEDTLAKMNALKARGVRFSLDDFGIGYSSLAYLKSLPLDQLKIDRSFIRDVLTYPNDAAIARSIIALGQSLGLAVIAEGVETEEQRTFLAFHGCRAYQGFLFGSPAPVDDMLLSPETVRSH